MRKSLLFLLTLVSAIASAQTTIPVTGNVSQILGSPQPYASVTIQLQNCPAPVSVPGSSVIVNAQADIQADASGFVNSTVIPNNLIDCNGTTGNSQYAVQYIVGGVPSANPVCFQVTSTQGIWNLNTQQPIVCGQTPPAPSDATYTNLVVTNFLTAAAASFSSTVTFNGSAIFNGAITIPARTACVGSSYMTNISTALQPVCGIISGFLTSFNGRTGPSITPQSGDYNYGQISGTPPTTATLVSNPDLVNATGPGTSGQPSCWNTTGGVGNCTKAQIALPSTAITANTCTTPATQALTGVRSTSSFSTAFTSNPSGANGWGAVGGLVVELWPDAANDVFDWSVCNQTTSSITPGAMTLNVGVN